MRRKYEVKFRLNQIEFEELKCSVEKSGLSREAYLRAMVKNRPITERPSMDLVDVLRNLQQINNNMNQIATKANSLNFVDTAAYWENVEVLKDTIGKLLEVMYD